jgi:hypothetical protein
VNPDGSALADLTRFAQVEVAAHDVEPWAELLAHLHRSGQVDEETALWLIKLYNATDDLGSATRIAVLAGHPIAWPHLDEGTRATVGALPLSQERRNLRGGRILRHLDSYSAATDGMSQRAWLGLPLLPGDPPTEAFEHLMPHLQSIWGTGRLSAFEWAEFCGKVVGMPVTAGHGHFWESSGPRTSLAALHGLDDAPDRRWLDDAAEAVRAHLAAAGTPLGWEDFETVICDFHVMRSGRYYPGQHLGMIREELLGAPGPWRERLDAAWHALIPPPWRDTPPGVNRELRTAYRDTGRILTPFGVLP